MISSKADTLIQAQNSVKNFIVPKLYVFKVKNWNKDKNLIIKQIQNNFTKKKIIIRSSSSNEDNLKTSAAGKFVSVLNINSQNKNELKSTINKVIKGYKKYSKKILNEQILVQEMITNIKMSGVIFTSDFSNHNLYYTINYDDITGLTNTITSGSSNYSNKTIYILKNKTNFIRSKRFKLIIKATKELESFYKNIPLDIEFGLSKKNEIFLFQVRPIVIKNKNNKINKKNFTKEIFKINKQLKKYFLNKKKDINGVSTLLSQMSDWNPVEMIGQYPSILSYSLYEKLITKSSWLKARKFMGYKSFKNNELMYKIGGKPYIDVRKSLNSFLPEFLPKNISDDLVNYGIDKLKKEPELHDKIEFSLAPTCFTFDIDQKLSNIFKKKNNIKKKKSKEAFLLLFIKNLKKHSPGTLKVIFLK